MDGYSPHKVRALSGRWRTPVFFLHVPKTAGTSVRHFLESSLQPHEVHRIEDTQEEIRRRAFAPLSRDIMFASGHVPYWYRDAFPERPRVLVFVRHPVERTLSTYRFWRGLPPPAKSDTSADAVLVRAAQQVSLEEFVNSPDSLWWGAISNYATWLVGHGAPWNLDAPADALTPRLAQSRLAAAEMIGVCERMDESLMLIAHSLGVPFTRSAPVANVSAQREGADRLSQSVLRAIVDANEHDMALWEIANNELDRRAKSGLRNTTFVQMPPLAERRLQPKACAGGIEMRPGQDAILGEGWLPPESQDGLSWRFAASPGPAQLHLQWPIHSDAYALHIDSPFSGRAFDYESLRLFVDDALIPHIRVQLRDRVVIITRPINPGRSAIRTLTFEYDAPPSAEGQGRRRSHDQQIAFAVSRIRWTPCVEGDWQLARDIATLATEQGSAARRSAKSIAELEAMIAKKDDYIASLTRSIIEKDAYALSLQRALEAKSREIERMQRGHPEASLSSTSL